jgi:hypothetical protein
MENDYLKKIKITLKALYKRTLNMPNKDHFLYKNLIFKTVGQWEHAHFADSLGNKH